jgi:hypothetical protein
MSITGREIAPNRDDETNLMLCSQSSLAMVSDKSAKTMTRPPAYRVLYVWAQSASTAAYLPQLAPSPLAPAIPHGLCAGVPPAQGEEAGGLFVVIPYRVPISGQGTQDAQRLPIRATRHDARQSEHSRSLVYPDVMERYGLLIMDP